MFPMQKLSRFAMLITILAAPVYAQSGKIGEVRVVQRYVQIRSTEKVTWGGQSDAQEARCLHALLVGVSTRSEAA